jgi:hypothetical protein
LEAVLAERRAWGFDIDPLARLVSRVKVTPLDATLAAEAGQEVQTRAAHMVQENREELQEALKQRWDAKTKQFVDYWFAPQTQIELLALMIGIERIPDPALKAFLELAFSAIIITKSGGVSLALDLAHTRPHRAKIVLTESGEVISGQGLINREHPRARFLTKNIRSALSEFGGRLSQNLKGLLKPWPGYIEPQIQFGNAQDLSLDNGSVDLIVTSPPYASNAIDYMRAHKFSLVWLGYRIDKLGQKRREYIGGEATTRIDFEDLPDQAAQVVADVAALDEKKAQVLHRYYSEMTRTLQEMHRVLKPGRAAIVVVGSSVMRGRDTETHLCLADIGRAVGFEVPEIGVRHLDRNRRMMPAGAQLDLDSQIQQRMHEEYVIGFFKSQLDLVNQH